MARRPDVLYINTYVPGSAAPKLEPRVMPGRPVAVPRPKARPKTRARKVRYVDPIALCATVVAAAMLIVMAVGMIQLGSVNSEAKLLEEHVAQLREGNAQLHSEFKAGYDLAQVRDQALDLGLVPSSQVEHVTIHVIPPQPVQEPSAWESFWSSIAEMFA